MSNLQLPLNQDHEVLGSEYCSGYTDVFNQWNTGFYCPASDESQDVFCCGTQYHKYCCTKKDQVIQSEVPDLTILIGILVGTSAAILLLTFVSCFCCSCCLLYKKRHSSGSNLRFANLSDPSGHNNCMYNLSGSESRSGTPCSASYVYRNNDGRSRLTHSYTLPHNLSHQSKHSEMMESGGRRAGTLGRIPIKKHQPPSYDDLSHNSYLIIPANDSKILGDCVHHVDDDVISISGSVIEGQPLPSLQIYRNESSEQLFHSTKF